MNHFLTEADAQRVLGYDSAATMQYEADRENAAEERRVQTIRDTYFIHTACNMTPNGPILVQTPAEVAAFVAMLIEDEPEFAGRKGDATFPLYVAGVIEYINDQAAAQDVREP